MHSCKSDIKFAGENIPFVLIGDNVHLLKLGNKPIIQKEAREFANNEGGIYIEIETTSIDVIEGALQKLVLKIIKSTKFILFFLLYIYLYLILFLSKQPDPLDFKGRD